MRITQLVLWLFLEICACSAVVRSSARRPDRKIASHVLNSRTFTDFATHKMSAGPIDSDHAYVERTKYKTDRILMITSLTPSPTPSPKTAVPSPSPPLHSRSDIADGPPNPEVHCWTSSITPCTSSTPVPRGGMKNPGVLPAAAAAAAKATIRHLFYHIADDFPLTPQTKTRLRRQT